MSVYLRKGKGWRYDFTLSGIRHTEAWFKTKREAIRAEAQKKEEVTRPQPVEEALIDMTFLELVNRRLDHINAYKSSAYYKSNRNMARKWIEEWGNLSCLDIKTESIEKFLLQRKTVSAYTANKELRHLRAMFNFGRKKKLIKCNPTEGVEFFPGVKKLKYIPPSEDIDRVLNVANQNTRDYLLAIRDTMARVGEINRLTWDDVDLENKFLVLYTRKKRGGHLSPRKVPMTKRLHKTLLQRHSTRDALHPWVFCNTYTDGKTGKRVTDKFRYRSSILKVLCRNAGVKRFAFHALRHAGASILDNNNVPLGTIQRILGHENRTTTEIYLHSIGGQEKEAMKIYESATQDSHTLSHDSHTDSHTEQKPTKKVATPKRRNHLILLGARDENRTRTGTRPEGF